MSAPTLAARAGERSPETLDLPNGLTAVIFRRDASSTKTAPSTVREPTTPASGPAAKPQGDGEPRPANVTPEQWAAFVQWRDTQGGNAA